MSEDTVVENISPLSFFVRNFTFNPENEVMMFHPRQVKGIYSVAIYDSKAKTEPPNIFEIIRPCFPVQNLAVSCLFLMWGFTFFNLLMEY